MRRQRIAGMTLVELMVVVIVVAILAAIAYPSYRRQVLRANRTEAKTALLQRAQAYERCFTRVHTYDGCDVASGPTDSGLYLIAAVAEGGTFSIKAEPRHGQSQDKECGTLGIDERGRHEATGTRTIKECW
jgi:type IV pilus assembly protein PilE